MRIHKGDTVKIIIGKDAGKSGKVIKADIKSGKVLLDGLNLYKKHVRPKKQGEKGEVVSVPRPMDASNVMLICSSCRKPSRAGYVKEGDKKYRVCKRCKARV